MTEIRRANQLPTLSYDKCLLVYDQRLRKDWGSWIKKFPFAVGVRAGESLKDLARFPKAAQALARAAGAVSPRELTVVAFGGGSVGDFAGFFASVYKRGVALEHVPSTWLAALDSAHGGKTALNLGGIKNQIGTFYPARRTWLVRDVLLKLGDERFQEARAEALKAGLLRGGSLWTRVRAATTPEKAWRLLPELIEAKMQIVRRDPFEQKGIRQLLNLGHTVGHVIEAELGLAHGTSVGLGLRFAAEWSAKKYSTAVAGDDVLPDRLELARVLGRLRKTKTLLAQDKKRGRRGVRFVFLLKPGRPVIEEVSVAAILAEIERQKRAAV